MKETFVSVAKSLFPVCSIRDF